MTELKKEHWRPCSCCKKPIGFSEKYFTCSVSTCNQQRTQLVFCSVACFERHLPAARHRDACAIEETAPQLQQAEFEAEMAVDVDRPAGVRRIVAAKTPANSVMNKSDDVLVVASKLKAYIRDRSDMNTSASVLDVLSEMIRHSCDLAIENARQEGRKTVMDRDFKK